MSLMNMAPSPEHDNEPKAPDKSDNKTSEGVELRTGGDFLEDNVSSPRTGDLQETSVSTLDDSQLKALLDEAITYKTPKDREGKSQIFKELLQEAEEDERNARAASASGPQLARYYNTAAARRHRNSTSRRENSSSSVSARLTHGGSLQDLAQPDLYADVVPSSHGAARRAANSRRRAAAAGHHHGGGHVVSVSARQREGGSLPSNVNAGATYDRQLFDTDTTDTSKCGRRKTTVKTSCTTTSAKPATACSKEKKMVEATETAALTTSTATVRPEYTVVELGQDADLEETRALLSQDHPPVVSYNSTAQCTAVPADVKLETNVATWSSENDQQTPASAVAQLHVASIHADVNEERSSATAATAQVDGGFGTSASTYHQQQNALEEAIQPHRLPRLRLVYTSRATLELDGIGGAITTSNTSTVVATSSVDKSITFPQLHQHTDAPALQLEGDYNSVRCIVESTSGNAASAGALTSAAATGETQPPRQQMTPSLSQAGPTSTLVPAQYRLLSVANPKLIHGVDRYHSEKKGLDENGNSVNTTSTALLDAKKKKKSKADRKVTVLSSEKIEGHRADIIESIDLLVKYIEDGPIGGTTSTPGKGGKPHHHHHNVKVTGSSKQHVQQQNNKNAQQPQQQQHQQQQQQQVDGKRRTRVKSKSDQGVVKKSNSLEEISKTKLEDLMAADDVSKCVRARVKKQSTSEDGDRRSWGTEDGQQYICGKISTTVYEPQVKEDSYTSLNILAPETAEFHVVTKKKKSKKRRSSSGGRHNHLFTGSTADDAQKIINHTAANHAYQQVTRAADHQHHHHHQKHHQVRGHHTRNSVFAQEAESLPARRKSACSVPPSDKSNDSSDVDSVHSLPAAVHTHSSESAAGETVDKQTLTSYADIARTSGGAPGLPVVSTASSASSNCSSHSGGSSGNVFIQQQVQPPISTSWKPVQPQQQAPVQLITPPAKNHTVLLRAEHFPELCETSALDDFPSLDQLQLSAARVPAALPGSKWTQVTSSNQQQPPPTTRVVVNSNCKDTPAATQVKKEPSANLNRPAASAAAAVNSVTHKPPLSVQRQPAPLPPQKPMKSPTAAPPVTDVKYCDMNATTTTAAPRFNSVAASKKLTPPAAVPVPVQSRRSHGAAAAPRPAVIILDDESNANGPVTSSSDPIQVSGLTFGFELNEQLLNNSAPPLVSPQTPRSLSPCAQPGDKYSAVLVNNNSGSLLTTAGAAASGGVLDAGSAPGDRFTARYLAPHTHGDITDTYNHDKIVTYVGLAWEDVVHQSNGKVQYYNGQ